VDLVNVGALQQRVLFGVNRIALVELRPALGVESRARALVRTVRPAGWDTVVSCGDVMSALVHEEAPDLASSTGRAFADIVSDPQSDLIS